MRVCTAVVPRNHPVKVILVVNIIMMIVLPVVAGEKKKN